MSEFGVPERTIRVGLLGAGAVGSQVARLLLEHADELAERAGARLELVGVAVRNLDGDRDFDIPSELLTTDAENLVTSSDVVVELIGGIHPARELIETALQTGADVVTANKALLATHGAEIFDAAARVGATAAYEAAVAGAIPILRPLRESLAGDRIQRVFGIVNGSTNFILDKMDREGLTAEAAAEMATELGYLEADPSLDVEGYDAAQKAAILASLAFHTTVPLDAVYREGITAITATDIADAKRAGYVIKLIALAERVPATDGGEEKDAVSVRVYPALISREHPLASVHGGNNAVFVQAEAAGDLMFYGAGAGGVQTASAVLGDLVSAVRRRVAGGAAIGESTLANLPTLPIDDVETRYQIALEVADEPGVLAQVASLLGERGVSIATALQSNLDDNTARLVIGTHRAPEKALRETVEALEHTDAVVRVASVLRAEGE